MHALGKSDEGMVSMKQTNKGEQPICGRPPAESVEKRPTAKGNSGQPTATGTQRPAAASSALARVREAARKDSRLRFTALLHHVTVDLLRRAYQSWRRQAAVGVDGVTWEEYGDGLEARLAELHTRLHSGCYRARPSKRIWISKSDGRQRPLGLAALEDKLVQQALVMVLQSIYEEDFLGFSYGFRPGRHQHQALDALYVAITQRPVSWVLDADIRGFFDSLDHSWLLEFVAHRVGDPRVLRLIRKFLRAGVSEDGEWSRTEVGTPQGAVISPLLANIYLHYVLDLWAHWWRRRHARGEIYIVRYADDFVVGFQYREDAERFHAALRQRLADFALDLHEDKTRLIEFGRHAARHRKARGEGKPATFDFLGFTHICGKRRKDGKFSLHRKTLGKRLRLKIRSVRETLVRERHRPVPVQGAWLRSVLQGHYNYYGVPGNRAALDTFRTQVCRAWLHALRRRSQRGRRLLWERFQRWVTEWIPTAHITHPYPNQRLCV
jgi:RNA-directed DNA polymerase